MKRNMKLLISLLLLVTVMPSCIYDEEPQDIDLTDGIRMGFTIRTAGDTSTRVGDADPETGSELENKIDIENRDFRVYFYHTDDNNNSFIGELEVMMVNRLDENGNYHVVGKIAGENMESLPENFCVVVMANLEKWGGYPKQPAYGTNSEAYSYSNNGYCVTEDKLIPMWGCHTYTGVTSQKGVVTQLTAPIDMLRAFAKIEVINETTDADSDLQLTEVSLTGHSNQFYIQPAASGYTGGNTNAGFTDCNVPNESSKLQTPLNFTEEKEEEISTEGTDTKKTKKTFVLYVPEYTTDSSNPMTLTVTFSNGVTRNIELSKDSPNINTLLRNHIYRFKVSLKKGTLNIWYQGIPWEKKDKIIIESGCEYNYNQSTNN